MGTDIRWFLEEYEDDLGRWEVLEGSFPTLQICHSPLIYGNRNYQLFARLGWGWKPGSAVEPPRGLPGDASPIVAAIRNMEGDSAWDVSWRSLDELDQLDVEDVGLREVVQAIKRVTEDRPARIIYWFE